MLPSVSVAVVPVLLVPVLLVPRVFFFVFFVLQRGVLVVLVRPRVFLVRGVQSSTSGSNSGSYGITRGMRNEEQEWDTTEYLHVLLTINTWIT